MDWSGFAPAKVRKRLYFLLHTADGLYKAEKVTGQVPYAALSCNPYIPVTIKKLIS